MLIKYHFTAFSLSLIETDWEVVVVAILSIPIVILSTAFFIGLIRNRFEETMEAEPTPFFPTRKIVEDIKEEEVVKTKGAVIEMELTKEQKEKEDAKKERIKRLPYLRGLNRYTEKELQRYVEGELLSDVVKKRKKKKTPNGLEILINGKR